MKLIIQYLASEKPPRLPLTLGEPVELVLAGVTFDAEMVSLTESRVESSNGLVPGTQLVFRLRQPLRRFLQTFDPPADDLPAPAPPD